MRCSLNHDSNFQVVYFIHIEEKWHVMIIFIDHTSESSFFSRLLCSYTIYIIYLSNNFIQNYYSLYLFVIVYNVLRSYQQSF